MKKGLKGVTDAMVFCKSMKKGGENNQIMRSMKSYMTGGATGLSSPAESADSDCTYVMEGYPPKKKKKCKGNHQSTRSYTRSRRVPGMH